jgi:hypothetical protein
MEMRLIKILPFLWLLISCKAHENIYGSYKAGNCSLELHENKRFDYRENKGLSKRLSDGVYEDIGENKFVLKSSLNINQVPIEVSSSEDSQINQGSVLFTIENKEKLNDDCVKGINLIINNNVSKQLKEFGTQTIPLDYNIKSLRVELLLNDVVLVGSNKILSSVIFEGSHSTSNKFSIKTFFTNNMFNYQTIISDTITIDKGNVVWENNENKVFVK